MSRGCDRTIGPKTATKRYGGASARCSALSQPDRPSDSLAFTLPPTTISTFNATLSLDRPFGSSGQKQPRSGAVQPQRHDPRHDQTTITADAAQLDKVAAPPEADRPRDLIDDERYATLDARLQREAEVDAIVTGWTKERDKQEAMAQLSAVGVPAGAVLDTQDLIDEPSFYERGILITGPATNWPFS